MNILAFDPGGTSGAAYFSEVAGVHTYELSGSFEDQALKVQNMFMLISPQAVVCETYTITQRTAQLSQQHDALMLIGLIRYFCIDNADLHMQSPAQAKGFATDAKLKAVGYWNKTPGGHANDSARHLLRFQAAHGLLSDDVLQKLADA